ncbi:MAG: hypothetical protein HY774_06945 [Acidobacteria bacterium]|nr:hypothetical protein [Acidobacteriota bacterium]
MAILNGNVSLICSRKDGENIPYSQFLEPLGIEPTDEISETVSDKGKWASSFVTFLEFDRSNFKNCEYPDEEIATTLEKTFFYISQWLGKRSPNIFAKFRGSGFKITLLVSFWIDQDQLDLDVPSSLLLQCGQREIKLQIISND